MYVSVGVCQCQSGTLKFELYQSAFRTLSDGQRAVDYEYATESCRGRKIEGAGGELFCVGVNNETPVQTIKRRVVATAVQRDGTSSSGLCT
jgi:hypothetical protein